MAVGLSGKDESRGPLVVIAWDAEQGRRYRTFEISADFLSALAFREDTLALAAATWSDVYPFEPDHGEDPTRTIHLEKRATALQYRKRGTLALLLEDGGLVLLRTWTGQVVRQVSPRGDRALGFAMPAADWSRFAAAAEGGVFVWEGA